MITEARIREELAGRDDFAWVTALRAPAIQKLVDGGALQLSLFDERQLAEISSPDYPGERLVVCRNPLLAAERARKRTELLAATEQALERLVAATQRKRNRLQGRTQIGLRVGRIIGRRRTGVCYPLLPNRTPASSLPRPRVKPPAFGPALDKPDFILPLDCPNDCFHK
jgi:hypothetical protein